MRATYSLKRGLDLCCFTDQYALFLLAQCKPGSFSSNGLEDAASPCELCPVGTYQPTMGSSTCMPCPQGMTTFSAGSPALRNCAGI